MPARFNPIHSGIYANLRLRICGYSVSTQYLTMKTALSLGRGHAIIDKVKKENFKTMISGDYSFVSSTNDPALSAKRQFASGFLSISCECGNVVFTPFANARCRSRPAHCVSRFCALGSTGQGDWSMRNRHLGYRPSSSPFRRLPSSSADGFLWYRYETTVEEVIAEALPRTGRPKQAYCLIVLL